MSPTRSDLRGACERCFGLCCVALPFSASSEFPVDKAAGEPCPNLRPDFGCAVHERLRPLGYAGCTVYDCFGAGQKVSEVTFGGRDWRAHPASAPQMFEVFRVMRHAHEVLLLLTEALALPAAAPVHADARAQLTELDALTRGPAEAVLAIDLARHRADAGAVLGRASELVRRRAGGLGADRSGADLVGARLGGVDLRRADLRGASLVGADLRRADLRDADLLGADLRGAQLAGADLRGVLFVTQPQLEAASGDRSTQIPTTVQRPAHW